ncbi:MAG: hypothetical protein ACRDZ4_06975 [Egibacteraceae bacterium]
MTPEERAALISDLRGVIENRAKLTEDVKEILKAEIPKLVAELRPKPYPFGHGSPFASVLEAQGAADMERAAGDLPPGAESPGPGRSRYIEGSPPPQTPCLRPLKQPIFDTLIVPVEGIASEAEIRLFTDPKRFPDGTRKMRRHCNLSQDGSLGYPLEYDMAALELRFEKWSHSDDVLRVLRGLRLSWYFGQNVPWLDVTASGFSPLVVLPHEVEDAREEIIRQIATFAERGVWPAWTHDITAHAEPDLPAEVSPEVRERQRKPGQPRRISSTESFSCGIEINTGGELHGPVTMKVMMQGTLYAQL